MSLTLLLALHLALPASAQDSMSYNGGVSGKAPTYVAGTPVNITHSGGNVSIRCQDTEGISAQINYLLDGNDAAQLEAMGNGILLRAWGDSNGGGVQSQVPYKPAGVETATIPLVVSLPRKAQVTVTNRGGWIEVLNCEGTITASTDQGGIFASGLYTRFDLASGTGDVTLKAKDGSSVDGASRAVASGGNVKIQLPLTINASLSATGSEVSVLHAVSGGAVQPNSVSGNIGQGGQPLRLQAQGKVEMSSP